jgi:hypothetical protein
MRTTYHDFDGWPRPRRAPQHAAVPFRWSGPARLQAHRALRLFGAAGLCAAGLCLVIGSIVLVTSQGRPGKLASASASSPARTGSQPAASTQSGVAGRGTTSLGAGGLAHHLIVLSTCCWTMKVTQQR